MVLIFAMQENKDAAGFLGPLATAADRLIAIDLPGETGGHAPDALAAIAGEMGMETDVAPSLDVALARAASSPRGRILICGSLYLVGEVLFRNYP